MSLLNSGQLTLLSKPSTEPKLAWPGYKARLTRCRLDRLIARADRNIRGHSSPGATLSCMHRIRPISGCWGDNRQKSDKNEGGEKDASVLCCFLCR